MILKNRIIVFLVVTLVLSIGLQSVNLIKSSHGCNLTEEIDFPESESSGEELDEKNVTMLEINFDNFEFSNVFLLSFKSFTYLDHYSFYFREQFIYPPEV